jgi:hypothetical protein
MLPPALLPQRVSPLLSRPSEKAPEITVYSGLDYSNSIARKAAEIWKTHPETGQPLDPEHGKPMILTIENSQQLQQLWEATRLKGVIPLPAFDPRSQRGVLVLLPAGQKVSDIVSEKGRLQILISPVYHGTTVTRNDWGLAIAETSLVTGALQKPPELMPINLPVGPFSSTGGISPAHHP